MDAISWYALGRTVSDSTTIMEEIDDKILTHNLDASAHGQSNEAVYNHRITALLDHVDGSVTLRKLALQKVIAFSHFPNYDGWEWHNLYWQGILNSSISTTDADVNAYIRAPYYPGPVVLDYSKNPFFQTTVTISQVTDQIGYIVAGSAPFFDEHDAFGFYFHDATLYAYWTKGGTEYTSEITGTTLTNTNVFRAICDSTAEEIEFYVNGVLKYTATTNYPTDTCDHFFTYYIESTNAFDIKELWYHDFLFEQDR